jgi:hypothetical protein
MPQSRALPSEPIWIRRAVRLVAIAAASISEAVLLPQNQQAGFE